MPYDVNQFPRIAYHPHLASYGHIGHTFIPPEWLEAQLSPLYPAEIQYMWSFPPYCIFVLGEGNEPYPLYACYLKSSYNEQLTTNGGADNLIAPCLFDKSVTLLAVGGDHLVDSSLRYLYSYA